MIRCVLFDLDGTLIDTAPDLGHALNLLRAEHRLPPLPATDYRCVASAGARGLLRLGFNLQPGDAEYDPLRQRFLVHYRQHLTRTSRPFEGIDAVLQQLAAWDIGWGIVTNKPGWLTQPLLAGIPFHHPPRCVISGDSATHPKPHPAPMLMACAQLGLAPASCLYVGDARRDIEAGHSAGMRTVAAQYGYIEADDNPQDWGADGQIAHPRDLLTWMAPHIPQSVMGR